MSCRWNSSMETGAVGNLEWGRTKGEIQSPSWNTLSLHNHLHTVNSNVGRDYPKATTQSWVFKGSSAAGSVAPPHVWPQGVIEIKPAANQCLPAGTPSPGTRHSRFCLHGMSRYRWACFRHSGKRGLHAAMTKRTGYCQGTFKNIYKLRFKKDSTGFSV